MMIREAAEDSVWGGHPVVVSRPQRLADLHFSQDRQLNSKVHVEELRPLLLVSSRISRTRDLPFRSGPIGQHARPLDDLKPLVITAGTTIATLLQQLSSAAGLSSITLRSDRAWVGGRSPLNAQLALPAAHHLSELLDDYLRFLRDWQDCTNEMVHEAIAYQYLCIHPLSDGNGRIIRALLARLAVRTSSIYPMLVAWRLKFDSVRCFQDWIDAALTGRAVLSMERFEQWRRLSLQFHGACRRAIALGLDPRALDAQLAFGVVNETAVSSLQKNCSGGLSRRVSESYHDAASSAARGAFESEIEEAIRKCTEFSKGT